MFVDASALVAILTREPEAVQLALRLQQDRVRYTSPIALYEAALGIARSRRLPVIEAHTLVEEFLTGTSVEIVSIIPEIGRRAIAAFERVGRGRHPARLNMGDCFSYACARSLGAPLLCKGDDFPQTDIELA
jgi:ribonuclease VapC